MQPKKIIDSVARLKRHQNIRLYTVVAVMSVIIIALVMVLVKGTSVVAPAKRPTSYKAPITSGTARLDPKEVYLEKFATDHELQTKRLDAMERMLAALLKINERAGVNVGGASASDQGRQPKVQPLSLEPIDPLADQYLIDPYAATTDLRASLRQTNLPDSLSPGNLPQGNSPQGNLEQLSRGDAPKNLPFGMMNTVMADNKSAQQTANIGNSGSGNDNRGLDGSAHPQNNQNQAQQLNQLNKPQRFRSKGIQRTSLMLANSKSNKHLKTADNTIPAGAFAGAVMIGGVDASTSIQASSNPHPVLLRVTDHGTLPRKFKSDLCGCHVLAACYGDISSERVYMRLEKLTCTERKTGEVVEMAVNGYVAGEDGRAGLRGIVVDRAGESMRNAAIGGFLSGMGNFLSQSHSPVMFSPANGLAQTNPMTNPDMLKFGAAKGASGALDKYADFYIKRAEQMQPVIQVQAGRRVDIVFTQGVAFENSAARGEMIKVNDQQRLSQLHNPNESVPKPIKAWVPANQGGGQGK